MPEVLNKNSQISNLSKTMSSNDMKTPKKCRRYMNLYMFWIMGRIWDLVRAARAIFFNNFYLYRYHKISLQFFCLIITQKANFLEHFEVWKFFSKIRFFRKFSKFQKFLKIFKKILKFSRKNTIFKSHYSNQFKRYENFENT